MKNKHITILIIISVLLVSVIGTFIANPDVTRDVRRLLFKEEFRTALYENGSLLIQESSLDYRKHEKENGKCIKTYPAYSKAKYDLGSDMNQHAPWYEERKKITSVNVENKIYPKSLIRWFEGCHLMSLCDISNIDTTHVTDTSYMFKDAGMYTKEFRVVGMDLWNTENIQNMAWMFSGAGCESKLFDLGDLSKWNTSSVTSMFYMFYKAGEKAKDWTIGDISNWDVSKVNNFGYMFSYAATQCDNWFMGDLTNWDIAYTDVENMFMNGYSFDGYPYIPEYYKEYILG